MTYLRQKPCTTGRFFAGLFFFIFVLSIESNAIADFEIVDDFSTYNSYQELFKRWRPCQIDQRYGALSTTEKCNVKPLELAIDGDSQQGESRISDLTASCGIRPLKTLPETPERFLSLGIDRFTRENECFVGGFEWFLKFAAKCKDDCTNEEKELSSSWPPEDSHSRSLWCDYWENKLDDVQLKAIERLDMARQNCREHLRHFGPWPKRGFLAFDHDNPQGGARRRNELRQAQRSVKVATKPYWYSWTFRHRGDHPTNGSARWIVAQVKATVRNKLWDKAINSQSPVLAHRIDDRRHSITVESDGCRCTIAQSKAHNSGKHGSFALDLNGSLQMPDPENLSEIDATSMDCKWSIDARAENPYGDIVRPRRRTMDHEWPIIDSGSNAIAASANDNRCVPEDMRLYHDHGHPVNDSGSVTLPELVLDKWYNMTYFVKRIGPYYYDESINNGWAIKDSEHRRESNDGEINVFYNGAFVARVTGTLGITLSPEIKSDNPNNYPESPDMTIKFGHYQDWIPADPAYLDVKSACVTPYKHKVRNTCLL